LFSTDSTHVDDLSDDEDECSSFGGLDGVAPTVVAILYFLFTFIFFLWNLF
jgi:hypothetical protein